MFTHLIRTLLAMLAIDFIQIFLISKCEVLIHYSWLSFYI